MSLVVTFFGKAIDEGAAEERDGFYYYEVLLARVSHLVLKLPYIIYNHMLFLVHHCRNHEVK